MDLENAKKVLGLYHTLKDGKVEIQKDKPVIIDDSLSKVLGIYGMDESVTVEWEGCSDE